MQRPRVLSLNTLSRQEILIDAGITPVDLPYRHDADDLRRVFPTLDGCVFWGGSDLPASWSQLPPTAALQDYLDCDDVYQRDWTEMILCRWALAHDLPIFGVCRGHQLLNVAAGGTLHQHVNGHQCQGHSALAKGSTEFASLLGECRVVNSIHHQAVDRLASGFEIRAYAVDGVVEAIESTKHTCAVGVQFHPEMAHYKSAMANLLPWFLENVKARHASKIAA